MPLAKFLGAVWLLFLTAGLAMAQSEAEYTTRFPVTRIDVQGSTAVSAHAIASITGPWQGTSMSIDDLRTVAAHITRLYRDKGFFLARAYVPPQEIADGVARITVVEGKIGSVTVEGNRHYKTAYIESFFAPLKSGGAADYAAFERALLLLNELMDLKVTAVLRKGVAADSTDVLLKVEDRAPFHVGLDYNNYGNRFVGQNRVGLGVFGGNLLTQGDNASLRAFLPFPSSSSPFYQAAYNVGLNNQGTRVGVSYANAALTVGQELAVLDIRSRANVYTAFASHPLTRTEAASSTVAGGLSFKDFNNTVLGIPSSHDRVRSLNLGLSGDFVGGGGKNIYALLLTQGLGGFGGGTRRGDPLASRAGASNAFTRLNVDLARIQKLSKLFLILRAAGQMAMDPLLVGEQFSLGGFDTVRGYRQSDFLGDSGYVLGGELRVPFSESPRHNVQGAVFIDHGHASLRSPAAGQLGSKSLTGVGVGLRASFKDNTAIRLDVGFPLSRPASSARKETVFYGQLTHTF